MSKILKSYFFLILLVLIAFFRIHKYCGGKFSLCGQKKEEISIPLALQKIDPYMQKIRDKATINAQKYFPSPHSELLLGMAIGLDYFSKIPKFKDALIQTGTIHVVVVSGFNIGLVYSLVWQALGSFYDRKKLIIGAFTALVYAALSGFEPPVVRSWVMGTLAYLGKHYGRGFPALQLVFVSALFMILWQPAYLFSVSFQLSLSATLSLLLFTDLLEELHPIRSICQIVPEVFREDFITTLSAQILVWPILSFYFGRVSLISLLVNTFVLWTVPISTILGGLFLFVSILGEIILGPVLGGFLASIFAFVVYIPLDVFVTIIQFFVDISQKWGIEQVNFQITSKVLCLYYLVLFLSLFLNKRKSIPKSSISKSKESIISQEITSIAPSVLEGG